MLGQDEYDASVDLFVDALEGLANPSPFATEAYAWLRTAQAVEAARLVEDVLLDWRDSTQAYDQFTHDQAQERLEQEGEWT